MNGLNDLNSIFGFGQLTLSRPIAKERIIESRSNRFCATHPAFLSHNEFNRCVARYGGNKSVRSFSCWDQFLTMAFAQLTYRESLRDIEVCLAAQRHKLYHSRLQWASQTFHAGRRQRETRLAHLPRFRAESDSDSTTPLCSFRVGARTGGHGLRLRRHHHRPLSLALSLGQIQTAQRRRSNYTRCWKFTVLSPSLLPLPAGGCARSKPARRTST